MCAKLQDTITWVILSKNKCWINICPLNNHYITISIYTFQDTVCYLFLWTTFMFTSTSSKHYSLIPHTHFGPQTWPVRSLDLAPLNYFLWGHMKNMVYWQIIAVNRRKWAAIPAVHWLHKVKRLNYQKKTKFSFEICKIVHAGCWSHSEH